jgi:hypothetical protein
MTSVLRKAAVVSALWVGVGVAGCATSSEWETWKTHPTHFASGDHAMFSLRNTEKTVRVSRADLAAARNESWWGKPLTVDQAQILER